MEQGVGQALRAALPHEWVGVLQQKQTCAQLVDYVSTGCGRLCQLLTLPTALCRYALCGVR